MRTRRDKTLNNTPCDSLASRVTVVSETRSEYSQRLGKDGNKKVPSASGSGLEGVEDKDEDEEAEEDKDEEDEDEEAEEDEDEDAEEKPVALRVGTLNIVSDNASRNISTHSAHSSRVSSIHCA